MAKQSIAQLKQWFETGDYPTQQQFWDWLDSFIHLDSELDIENIAGLVELLASKADASQLAALNNKLVIGPGVASYAIPAGTILESFIVWEPTDISFSAGKTVGGTDIIDNEPCSGGELIYDKKVSFKNAGNIYFTGITGNTIIIILKR